MKLYLLTNIGARHLDIYSHHLVRAKTEESARYLASQMAIPEAREIWLSSDKSSCHIITIDGEIGIVFSSIVS